MKPISLPQGRRVALAAIDESEREADTMFPGFGETIIDIDTHWPRRDRWRSKTVSRLISATADETLANEFKREPFEVDVGLERLRGFRKGIEAQDPEPIFQGLAEPAPDAPLVFISCGQTTDDERRLGYEIALLVRELTPFAAYFAQNQSDLTGLTTNIFGKLAAARYLVAVMHHRGDVSAPDGSKLKRGSVWVEQEIGIVSYRQHMLGGSVKVACFTERGLAREGARQYVHINAVEFRSSGDVLDRLEPVLSKWRDEAAADPAAPAAAAAALREKVVDLEYPEKTGLTAHLQGEGFRLIWEGESRVATRTEVDGWQLVVVPVDGGEAVLKLKNQPENSVLLKKRESRP